MRWFCQADMVGAKARTFVRDIGAPLSRAIRTALIDLFQMRWGEADADLSPEDRREYQRLCHPDSPDLILDVPEYYAFFTYTVFCGRVQ